MSSERHHPGQETVAGTDRARLDIAPTPLPRAQDTASWQPNRLPPGRLPLPSSPSPEPAQQPVEPGRSPRRWPSRRRQTAAAAVIGLLLIGTGYVGGRLTPRARVSPPRSVASAEPGRPSGSYAERQRAVNLTSLPAGDVVNFAQPWLTTVSDCRSNTTAGGPALGAGEQNRTRCSAGVATLYLVSYRTAADRDQARTRYLSLAATAASIAPQAAAPTRRPTSSGNSTGWYVEYAYRDLDDTPGGAVVAGLWWDSERSLAAGYLVAYWSDGLASSWAPLRDLWNRTS